MKTVIFFLFMVVVSWQFCLADPIQPPDSKRVSPAVVSAGTEYGNYRRVALALLQVGSQGTAKEGATGDGFLAYLDQPAAIKIVATAFQNNFCDEEASQIADFLSTPEGEVGVKIFSQWLLRGDFLKNPIPEGLASSWEAFRSTAAGFKLFSEVYSIYKEIAVEAAKIGGKLVVKAISSDIGMGAASSVLGALLKSGGFF